MTEHYCQRVIFGTYGGFVWTKLGDCEGRCNKIARFAVPSEFPSDPEEMWLCAECYDYKISVNRMYHEEFGTPLVEP